MPKAIRAKPHSAPAARAASSENGAFALKPRSAKTMIINPAKET